MQLIQYDPTTEKVGARPLLIVPPSINKFYILDLQPENSFIGHAVAQGNTVFVVSWRNVKQAQGTLTWDDYLQLGVVDTIEVVRKITGQKTINALGFCVGGTILCTALAALAAKGERPVGSLTLLTTLLDFEDPGTLGVFIDEMHVALARADHRQGRHHGRAANWRRPSPRLRPERPGLELRRQQLPEGRVAAAVRPAVLERRQHQPAGPDVLLVPAAHVPAERAARSGPADVRWASRIDLRSIDVPTYVLCTSEDHIVPWQAGFASAQTLGGERRFVVGASGHIAGVINPPIKNKRSFRTGPTSAASTPEDWLAQSTEQPGSWWTDWSRWLAEHQGRRCRAEGARRRATRRSSRRPGAT